MNTLRKIVEWLNATTPGQWERIVRCDRCGWSKPHRLCGRDVLDYYEGVCPWCGARSSVELFTHWGRELYGRLWEHRGCERWVDVYPHKAPPCAVSPAVRRY